MPISETGLSDKTRFELAEPVNHSHEKLLGDLGSLIREALLTASALPVAAQEEGLAIMNKRQFANGSVIYTQNGHYAREFTFRTDAGMTGVNVGIPVPLGIFGFTGHKAARIHLKMLAYDYPWDAVQMPLLQRSPRPQLGLRWRWKSRSRPGSRRPRRRTEG